MELIEITRGMYSEVEPLLREFDGPQSDWRQLFAARWSSRDQVGYALRERGEIVGFLGTVFADRVIGGRVEKFCNLTTWIVKEPYRKNGLQLLVPVLKLTDHTVTNLSPSPQVFEILRRVGFQILDISWRIIPTFTAISPRGYAPDVTVSSREDQVLGRLTGSARDVFEAHRNYRLKHVILDGGAPCHVVFASRRIRRVPFVEYAQIHHIGDPDVFWRYFDAFRRHLLLNHRIPLLMLDSRMVGDQHFQFERTRERPRPSLFRSRSLKAHELDNLYSELILLDF